jgi:translation initiation factor 1 (eIF-1/SUI1)
MAASSSLLDKQAASRSNNKLAAHCPLPSAACCCRPQPRHPIIFLSFRASRLSHTPTRTGGGMPDSGAVTWAVRATKKGELPVSVEKRGHHRVTVVRNVERPQLLSSALGKALGAGGSVSAVGDVEVQGQLQPRVEAFLRSNPGHLHGVRRQQAERPREATAAPAAADGLGSRRREGDERRHATGKARHIKAKASAYVLAGANDDIVAATIRAAQAAGTVGGWARCPHDWIYCTGRCQYPPSDDEDEDEPGDNAGSCRDLVSAEEAWVVLPEERRLALTEPAPEPELRAAPQVASSAGLLDAALQGLGMLACSSAVDDRGTSRSGRKVKVAERREERAAELELARAARAAQRRNAAHSWWPPPSAVTSAAAAAALPVWMRSAGSRTRATAVGLHSARAAAPRRQQLAPPPRSAKRQPQARKRAGGGGKRGSKNKASQGGGGRGGGGGKLRGAGSGRARPLWEEQLAGSSLSHGGASRYEDDMSDDIDRCVHGALFLSRSLRARAAPELLYFYV